MTGGKKVIIIAGPNGAGKTTFAMEYCPTTRIARYLSMST